MKLQMRKSQGLLLVRLALVTMLLLLLAMAASRSTAQNATVHFHFFYSDECEHCRLIKDEFLPALVGRYGDQIAVNYLEISDQAVFQQMAILERQYDVPAEKAGIPEIYIGDQVLVGGDEIQAKLPGLIDQFLAEGGTDAPPLPAAATGEVGKPVARFILFYGETCPHCHTIMDEYLPTVYAKYGDQVEHQYIEVWSDIDNYRIMLGLETKLGLPQDQQGGVPVLVIGDKVLIGDQEIPAKLETYIDEYLAQGGVDYPSLENLPQIELPTPVPSVQILVFLDLGHADTQGLNDFLTAMGQKYGAGLRAYAVDMTQSQNATILAQINAGLGVPEPPSGTPEVLIDHRMLVGLAEIQRELPGLMDQYLAQGGIDIPPLEELTGSAPAATPSPSGTATPSLDVTESAKKPIYLAYFEQAGCQECARTAYDLRLVQSEYPQVVVDSFAMEDKESQARNEWLCEKYGVPDEERLSTPMVFVGQDVLIGSEATAANLLAVVGKYAQSGAERTWTDFDPALATQNLVDRFRSFGVLTVLGAGLIDGLNPCAFATLVFFISYLAFTGRRGRDVLLVGISFAAGVFLTYLLVGVGLLKVVQSLSFFTALGRWIYLVTALLCVALAAFTFRDFFKARGGQATEMTLRLPKGMRRRINRVIRENAQVRAFVAVALVTGFVVSLLELACTGQVYLPTIMFVMSVPELAARALFYLLLYCIMFIVPLIVVFGLSYFGTTSDQLGQFVNRHTSTIKLFTGFVFVALALWMTWTLAPLFGVDAPWHWVMMGLALVTVALGAAILQVLDKRAPQKPAARRRRSRA
jgi:cytochrome c biogenesis protein CcdA/thiol-disulfide isomerase/thioredoxin